MLVSNPSSTAINYSTHNFAVADCLVNPTLNRISRAGLVVQVEPKVMQVLVSLASRGQEVVSKQELLDEVWPETFVSDHVLAHVVWQLRGALGSAELIETVPRRGYRLTVEAVAEAQTVPGKTKALQRNVLLAMVAVSVLVLSGALWLERHVALAQEPVRRIALLPLEAAVTGQRQQQLVAGINSSFQDQFLEIRSWQVLRARSTASLYAGASRQSPRELAQLARADAVVQGTAAVFDGRVQIALQVWDARAGHVVFSESFERDLQHLLQLYGEAVRKVAEAGNVSVSDAEGARLGGPTLQAEAASEYLMGLGLSEVGEYREQSLAHFRRTIELNPEFARPYSAAANLLTGMALNDPSRRDEARTMALKAVQRDPESARAHAVLGAVEANLFWNWSAGRKQFEQSAKLRADEPILLRSELAYEVQERECEKAMQVVHRLEKIDLSSSWPSYYAHWTQYMCGQFDAAINSARIALLRDPSAQWAHFHTAYAYSLTGHHAEAIGECERAFANGRCEEPFLLARAGRNNEARAALAKMEEENFPPFFIALGYTGLGDRDRAFEWLDKGYNRHDSNLRFIWDPAFTALRDDPRFRTLTCELDLPAGVCRDFDR